MKYGCIGEHLKHSFSKEIHNSLADYEYKLCEIPKDKLDSFMDKRDFLAINVTIPYKEAVIPHLHFIDEFAREIGAVNTVVNRDGRLYGYNTDFYGMSALFSHVGIDAKNKKVIILGTGGTSKTAYATARSLGAAEVIKVSRTKKGDAIDYNELYEVHADADIVINTTPSGMFPNIFDAPVDISRLPRLSGVIDAVYNPLRTPLISAALERGIRAEGGLYMLVAQAVRASEIFIDTKYRGEVLESVYEKIKAVKENIVLIGMPASGKSTVGKLLAQRLDRKFIDTDKLIVERSKKSIPEIFAECGERGFRDVESEVIKEVASSTSAVISTGGGAILRGENITALKENGRVYFIDRPLEKLMPTNDRPLSSDRASIEKRYSERYHIYTECADKRIDADCTPNMVSDRILEDFCK